MPGTAWYDMLWDRLGPMSWTCVRRCVLMYESRSERELCRQMNGIITIDTIFKVFNNEYLLW